MYQVEVFKSELDVFAAAAVQTSVESGKWVAYNPISTLENNTALEFVCPASADECIDLAHSMIQVKTRITKKDGSNTVLESKVAPVNNFLHSLFEQVEVYLNNKLISPAANAYPYRAYIETLLNYDQSAKESHLTASLWYKDTAGQFNDVSGETTNNNIGYVERQKLASQSRTLEMFGPIFSDLFNVGKYLIPGVELRVKFIRSRDSFALMAENDDFKVQLVDAVLHIRKARIAPKILLAHESALRHGTAKYPMTRTETKVMTIGSGLRHVTLDNVYLGQIPKRIVLGLVTNTAYSGNIKKNAFEFGHHNLNHLAIYVDNEQFPNKPLRPDYANRSYTMAYYTLFSGTGIHFKDAGNAISIDDYDKGYALYAFDLTSDLSASTAGHWQPTKTGQLRIELGFAENTAETLNCVVYAEFQSLLQIDQQRNVVVDT